MLEPAEDDITQAQATSLRAQFTDLNYYPPLDSFLTGEVDGARSDRGKE